MDDFIVFDKNKPIVNIVQSEDDFEFPSELSRVLETDLKIGEYITKYKRLLYRYDFGDGWEHIMEFEDLKFDFDKNYSVCLDDEGNAPPEYVGAEGGYEEFLKIMSNPDYVEYADTKHWTIMQGYKEFNLEQVNRSLKRLL